MKDKKLEREEAALIEALQEHLSKIAESPRSQKLLKDFRDKWVGRTFRCKKTGVEFTIPEDVFYKQFFSFGDSFIDVGDGYYSRVGGDIEEVFKED